MKAFIKAIIQKIYLITNDQSKDIEHDYSSITRYLFGIEKPADIRMREAGVKKVIYHSNSGWHFSHMTGGFTNILTLKSQNYSHSEWSTGEELDTNIDYYELQQEYIFNLTLLGAYDYNNLHSEVPDFIVEKIRDYCFLLQPQDI